MRGRYEQNQGYSKSGSALTSSAQKSRTVAPTSTRRLGKKLSVGILLTTLTILLITVGSAGYRNGGTDLIDHDTSTYIALAKYIQQNRALSALSLIHISEPTRLRRISYAVFCLKKKKL